MIKNSNPDKPEPLKNITKTRKDENTKKKEGRILFRVFPPDVFNAESEPNLLIITLFGCKFQ